MKEKFLHMLETNKLITRVYSIIDDRTNETIRFHIFIDGSVVETREPRIQSEKETLKIKEVKNNGNQGKSKTNFDVWGSRGYR